MTSSRQHTRLDCVRDLITAASTNKFSTLKKFNVDDEEVFDVWDNISQLVEYHMQNQKAVQIPGFGVFTFITNKLDMGQNKHILNQRPIFILSEKLARTHRLTQSKYHVPGEIPVVKLNFTTLSYELNIDRDFAEAAVKEIVNAFSRSIEHSPTAAFGFTTIGSLVVRNGIAKMKFLPTFIEKIDESGKLSKYMKKRPVTSDSNKSVILPKIIPEDNMNEVITNSLSKSTEKKDETPVLPKSRQKEIITPKLKSCSKSLDISPTSPRPAGTSPTAKQQVPCKSVTINVPQVDNLVNDPLKGKDKHANQKDHASCCKYCRENSSDFCYLHYQRERRNLAVYENDLKRQKEENEDMMLQMFTQFKDSQDLKVEQDAQTKKREEAKSVAAFNLGVSESLKMKKEERPVNFQRSYMFGKRPITPPHYSKQDLYETDLAKQVSDKARKVEKAKKEELLLGKIEQIQMAEDLKRQRNKYLRSKRKQSEEYRKSLDSQVHIMKCLKNGSDERVFSLPPPNVALPFQKKLRIQDDTNNMMAYWSLELPVAYPDSDGPVFGVHDTNDEKKMARRRQAKCLYQNQLEMTAKKRKSKIAMENAIRKEEEEILKKTKAELLQETLLRSHVNLKQRQDLEKNWSQQVLKKREQEAEERSKAHYVPAILLQEQCDTYDRCGRCTRQPHNYGGSNLWPEPRCVFGSRLMV